MEMKLGNVVGMVDSLKDIIDKEVPVKTAIKLSKLVKSVEEEIEIFDKKKQDLIKKYGKVDDFGNIVPDEKGNATIVNMASFQKEFSELVETEVEINIQKIKLEELGDINLKTNTLIVLGDIIEE